MIVDGQLIEIHMPQSGIHRVRQEFNGAVPSERESGVRLHAFYPERRFSAPDGTAFIINEAEFCGPMPQRTDVTVIPRGASAVSDEKKEE